MGLAPLFRRQSRFALKHSVLKLHDTGSFSRRFETGKARKQFVRRPWLGPAMLATLLFVGSISTYGQSNQQSIAQWDIETRNGITDQISGNGSIIVMGDIVIVGFSVGQENMEDDDRWELWMKHDGIWTLLQNGEISDGENLENTDVGIPINSTGLFESQVVVSHRDAMTDKIVSVKNLLF